MGILVTVLRTALLALSLAGLLVPAALPLDGPPAIKALPSTIRHAGLLVAVDAENAELAIRGDRGVRRAFKVEGAARASLSSLSLGDEVLLTCRTGGEGPTVVHIEVVPI